MLLSYSRYASKAVVTDIKKISIVWYVLVVCLRHEVVASMIMATLWSTGTWSGVGFAPGLLVPVALGVGWICTRWHMWYVRAGMGCAYLHNVLSVFCILTNVLLTGRGGCFLTGTNMLHKSRGINFHIRGRVHMVSATISCFLPLLLQHAPICMNVHSYSTWMGIICQPLSVCCFACSFRHTVASLEEQVSVLSASQHRLQTQHGTLRWILILESLSRLWDVLPSVHKQEHATVISLLWVRFAARCPQYIFQLQNL